MADTPTNSSILLEGDTPGLPLVISFGFYNVNNEPHFDFYGRLKKVELVSGRVINRLYVRDPKQLWYLQGVEGIGDVDETVAHLRGIIAKLNPSFTATIGQSMGAYAAVLYGTLLGVDKVIAFGPLSSFDKERWSLIGERRWQTILDRLTSEGGATNVAYTDLVTLLQNHHGKRPAIDLLYGMAPDDNGASFTSTGHDVAHAMRFDCIPGITLLPVAAAPHAVVEYFRRNRVITDVIMRLLFGTDFTARIVALQTQEPKAWMAWIVENIARGVPDATLIDTMRQQNMDETTIRTLIDAVNIIPVLRTIAERSAPIPELSKAPYDPDEEEEPHVCCTDPRHQHR